LPQKSERTSSFGNDIVHYLERLRSGASLEYAMADAVLAACDKTAIIDSHFRSGTIGAAL
jgi:hypothetical protein